MGFQMSRWNASIVDIRDSGVGMLIVFPANGIRFYTAQWSQDNSFRASASDTRVACVLSEA